MATDSELKAAADALIDHSKDDLLGTDASGYAFRKDKVSGEYYVAEWDPQVHPDGSIYEHEARHDVKEWLGEIASICNVEASENDAEDLAMFIEQKLEKREAHNG